MSRPVGLREAVEFYREKDFYLEEFRGLSVLMAVSPAAVEARPDLRPLAATVADLERNGTRVVLWWPATDETAVRRLRAALTRARGRGRRRRGVHRPLSVLRLDAARLEGHEALRARLWAALRRQRVCIVVVRTAGEVDFSEHVVGLAIGLGVRKLVMIDPHGGLLAAGPARLSFVDENVLETLLRHGEAEWSGLGDRRALLVAVRAALRGGVEAVNLCTAEDVGEELFSYVGSGTLFTRGDYCHVGPLALDDFAQAERLLERGQREGLLKHRTQAEIAEVVGGGFGAKLSDRHLAGVAALLTAPYAAERTGEIVGLYTITRFKGESIGERLVSRLLVEAERRGLVAVFACAVDERAAQFFARLGFERVGAAAVPAVKWAGYDARRRSRLAVFRRALDARRVVQA